MLLQWRVGAIARELRKRHVNICILPGARFPPGSQLPCGFPFQFLGVDSDPSSAVLICAFYPKPGVDLETWTEILKSFKTLTSQIHFSWRCLCAFVRVGRSF
jgi:hypothetical protein